MIGHLLLWPIRWTLWAVLRVLLALRYRVKLAGKAKVRKSPGPYLILPNHVAYVDPPLLLTHLWPSFQMRPLLLETNFQNPLLAPLGFLLRAVRMPKIFPASVSRGGGERKRPWPRSSPP